MQHFDVVVLGGGPAGVTAALRACELGASVALVERGRLGGTCTNDGCAPTRVLAHAARLIRDARQFNRYGLIGDAPAVDLPALLAHTQERVYRLHEKKQLIDHLHQAGVSTFTELGPAAFVDPHTIRLGNGALIHGESFILCVGGKGRRIPLPGSDYALTHNDIWTLTRVPHSVAIVGAAATGCQLGSIFDAFGAHVTLLERSPFILSAEDKLVGAMMRDSFELRGIDVITAIDGVDGIEKQGGDLYTLRYRRDGEAQQLDVEAVILAIGWVGNVDALNLDVAGVEHARGYVVVDDTLRTTAPHIFAAGDITGRMMLVQSAAHEARVAAENAILGSQRDFRHLIVPHGGFTDPEYGSVGLTEAQARAEGEVAVAVVPFTDLDRAVIDGRPEGFCKLVVARDTGHILGAHVVGENALEVVHIAATAMAAGMTVDRLAELELAYPTIAAVIGLAARQLVRELALTPLAANWAELKSIKSRVTEWERSTWYARPETGG